MTFPIKKISGFRDLDFSNSGKRYQHACLILRYTSTVFGWGDGDSFVASIPDEPSRARGGPLVRFHKMDVNSRAPVTRVVTRLEPSHCGAG